MFKPQLTRISAEIANWRDREKLSQEALAARVGVSQSTVSRVLTGKIRNEQVLNTLCTITGVDLHRKDVAYSPILTQALNTAWDGTEEQAQAIAMLLLAALKIAERSKT